MNPFRVVYYKPVMNEEQKPAPAIVVPEGVAAAVARYKENRGRHREAKEDREVIATWVRESQLDGSVTIKPLAEAIGIDYSTLYGWAINYGLDMGFSHERTGSAAEAKRRRAITAKNMNAKRREERAEPVFARSFVVPADAPETAPAPVAETVPAVKAGKFILFVGDNDTLETAIKGLREIFNK